MAIARPPGPPNLPVIGQLLAFRRDPLALLTRFAARYGDVVFFRLGPYGVYLINHPELIREVLVVQHDHFMKGQGLQLAKRFLGEGLLTSEGEFHRRQRRLSQPAFHRQRVSGYAEAMVELAERAQTRWQDGQNLDASVEMSNLTLAIVARTLFASDVSADAAEIRWALAEIMHSFLRMTHPLAALERRLPLPSTRRFRAACSRLDATIYRIIAERRAAGRDQGDLLSMLLLAQDEDGSAMNDQQLRDEAMTLFLAGHETTANALTWTWYLLAQHPEVEARLHSEIDSILGDGPAHPNLLPQLRYTEMVLCESMRLYPPAWTIGRRVLEPCQIGQYLLQPENLVLISQYVVHRDARYFPEPGRFDPQRWTVEARAARPKFSYFPFGGGARQCIGETFAWTEAILVLATLGRRWRMRRTSQQAVRPQPSITLRPRGGMPMRLERR